MVIPIYYEIPIFLIIALLIYFIFKSYQIWDIMGEESFKSIFFWLILSALSIMIWALDHLYHDLFPPSENIATFLHYGVSHTFLLIGIVFLAIAGNRIGKFLRRFNFRLKE